MCENSTSIDFSSVRSPAYVPVEVMVHPKGSKKVERATKSHTLTKTHLTSPLKPINLIFWGF
jgi:hypothetical protein